MLAASRRSRSARRRAIVGGTLAVAGVVVVGGLTFGAVRLGGAASSSGSAADAPVEAPGSGESFADPTGGVDSGGEEAGIAPRDPVPAPDVALDPLATFARCGAPSPAPQGDSADGGEDVAARPLRVSIAPIGSVAPGAATTVAVTVRNAAETPLVGSIRTAPVLAVADGAGLVVAHSPADGFGAARDIRLAPGASLELSATLTAVRCSPTGDQRADQPLDPGAYTVRATVVLVPLDGDDVLTGSADARFDVR
ncbi:hypothetical protein ET445_15310 [Agromyces protaetiae]|uniref:Uncharacterized protein n=1 Tax=Agromyces protaetiae TaxID=2509455 RepID=A0A4P6FE37_9MICO|nr:hypothetical protein [Agromyces protaetiae]QAY74490.1 hypothetical protein ET445_15310 [Agromyces protaetiae]